MLFNLILCYPGTFKHFLYLSHEVSFFLPDDSRTGIFCHYMITGRVLLQMLLMSISLLLGSNFYTFTALFSQTGQTILCKYKFIFNNRLQNWHAARESPLKNPFHFLVHKSSKVDLIGKTCEENLPRLLTVCSLSPLHHWIEHYTAGS